MGWQRCCCADKAAWQERLKKLEVERYRLYGSKLETVECREVLFLGTSDDSWRESAGLFSAILSPSDIWWGSYFFILFCSPSLDFQPNSEQVGNLDKMLRGALA